MGERYGTLYPRFWDGPTGQAIQRKGKNAVILAAFLTSNRYANMIGLYELPLPMMAHALIVLRPSEIKKALDQLSESDVSFAFFDRVSSHVWVKEMARIRLQLEPGDALGEKDKRVAHITKIYAGLKPNAYLSAFYERYSGMLRLPRRRDGLRESPELAALFKQAPLQGASRGASQAPIQGVISPFEASKQVQEQVPEELQAAAAPPSRPQPVAQDPADNVELITALVRKELLTTGIPDDELTEATKERCARYGIAYTSAVVGKAIESALHRRQLV